MSGKFTSRTARAGIAAVLFVLALLAGVIALFSTSGGQAFLTVRILNAINTPSATVGIGTVGGDWPGEILLTDVTVADSAGVWLTIDRLALRWHPLSLLRGRINVETVAADNVAMARAPAGDSAAPVQGRFDLDGFLGDLRATRVMRATVQSLALAEPVAGMAIEMRIAGSLDDAGEGAQVLRLQADRTDAPGTALLSVRAERAVASIDLSAETEGLSATAAVTIARADDALAGSIRIARQGAAAGGEISAVLAGTRHDPEVAADFAFNNLDIAGRVIARADGSVRAARTAPGRYGLSGSGTLSDLRLFLPELPDVLASEGRWSLAVTQTSETSATLESFRIEAGDTTLTVSGTYADTEMKPASIVLTVRGIGRVLGIAGDSSVTTLNVTAERFTAAGEGEGTITASATGLNAAQGDEGLPPALRASARWTADARALRITGLTGLASGLTLTGESTWPRADNSIDHGTSTLTLAVDPRRMNLPAADPLRVNARFDGALAQLRGAIKAEAALLGPEKTGLRDLAATLDITRAAGRTDAALDARGTWQSAPVTLTARAFADEAAFVIEGIQAESLGGRMDGGFAVDTASGLATGELNARLGDVRELAGAFGIEAGGAMEASLALVPTEDGQRTDARVAITNLASNPLVFETLTVTARIEDSWRARRFDARLETGEGSFIGRGVKALTARASGDTTDFTVVFDAASEDAQRFAFGIGARVAGADDKTVTFTRLMARDNAFTMELGAPAVVALTQQRISSEAIRLAVAGGTLNGSFDVDRLGGTVTGMAEATDVGLLAFIPAAYPASNGVASGTLSIGGTITDATLLGALNARFAPDRRNATPAFTANIDVKSGDGRLSIDARVEGFSQTPATVVGELPFRLDLTGPRMIVDADGPLQLAAHWDGSIAPIWRLLPIDEHLITGDVLLDMTVTGTPAAPLVQGRMHLTKGTYENIPGGTVLRNVDLNLTTERGDDLVVALTATGPRDGTASVSGRLLRDTDGAWTADLAGEVLQLAILARDDVTASASGKVTYTGPLLSGVLKGNLAIVRGTIHLDATGVPEVPLLRSHKFSQVEVDEGAAAPVVASPMRLDVSLSMADPLRVEGRGLESVWRGQLYVGGSIVALDVEGGLALERGTFSFLGQSFELESGTATFTGGGQIDPQLSVVAVRVLSDITVTVNITGRASAPQIALSSRPGLPQDEVLARLLFNRNAGELGPLESLQLANAAADMSGLARGGISGMVRRTFGLDTFGFGGRSGDALVVGRQLGRNVFVSVEQSVNSTSRLFILTWRLSQRFSLRSSASDETGADIGVFWRKDY